MRSGQLDLRHYDTDKVANGYLRWYDPVLAPWVGRDITLLELGVYRGGSLLLWRDYFPQGRVVGVDVVLPEGLQGADRLNLYQGSQTDTAFLDRVRREAAPNGFDIIIDDASHVGELSRIAFWHLFEHHLKPGGLYVVEDWGTGYWDDWPDGRTYRPPSRWRTLVRRTLDRFRKAAPVSHTHCHGMVGFVKELIDEQGAADLTRRRLTGTPERGSRFESVLVTPSIVFVRKPEGGPWPNSSPS